MKKITIITGKKGTGKTRKAKEIAAKFANPLHILLKAKTQLTKIKSAFLPDVIVIDNISEKQIISVFRLIRQGFLLIEKGDCKNWENLPNDIVLVTQIEITEKMVPLGLRFYYEIEIINF